MKVYIQNAVVEWEELDHVDMTESLELYRRHDWKSERLTWNRLISEGVYGSSPHMAWVHNGGSSLSMHPSSGSTMIIYSSGKKYRLFGVIPTPADDVIAVDNVADRALEGILASFYREDAGMKKLLRKSGTREQLFC
jgi:hypothetical protein